MPELAAAQTKAVRRTTNRMLASRRCHNAGNSTFGAWRSAQSTRSDVRQFMPILPTTTLRAVVSWQIGRQISSSPTGHLKTTPTFPTHVTWSTGCVYLTWFQKTQTLIQYNTIQ